jgi:hypothetical protein
MQVWAVVSRQTTKAIELFQTKQEAERMVAEVLVDEPDMRAVLSVERIEQGQESLN